MTHFCESCHEIGTHAIGCPDDESDAAIDRVERTTPPARQRRTRDAAQAKRRRKAQRRARVATRGAAQ